LAVVVAFISLQKTAALPHEMDSFGTDSKTFLFLIVGLIVFVFLFACVYKKEHQRLVS